MAVAAASSPNMTVVVGNGSAVIPTGTYPSSYGYLCANDTSGGEGVTITTASSSNPRIDAIAAYINKGATVTSSPANNPGILVYVAVAGTPAASPVAPTNSAIQSAIGASNPYVVLANVTVGTSVTQINSGNITDVRAFAQLPNQNVATNVLGYASRTTNVTSNATSPAGISGLTVTVTIPSGGRRIKITAFAKNLYISGGSALTELSIWDGTVGTGTQLAASQSNITSAGSAYPATCIAVASPPAGSKTYNVGIYTSNASYPAAFDASTAYPAFILVEAI